MEKLEIQVSSPKLTPFL